ncbi:MAG: GspH/FimT family protein [Candidatus Rokubacteria bacterium]|nr:GspH/FimT family protein [Candidatus Rokubacteria bacterium]MBI3824459.1 GspH/FimT family protein [Candidatus Rokubacteria bacterium]
MGQRAEVTAARSGPAGFTLIELVVTLLVLALAAAVVAPAVGRSMETIRARAQVAGFAALLRHSREQAVSTHRRYTVVVDPGARSVSVLADDEVREVRPLPASLVVEASPPPALSVRFEPQGVSSGGDFRLTSGRIAYRVTIDPLTSRVRTDRR